MPAPSLAGEIAQLHELFTLGALTEEEFNAAKQATLRNFMSKANAASPPPSLPPATAATAAAGDVVSPSPPPERPVVREAAAASAASITPAPAPSTSTSASSSAAPSPSSIKTTPTRSREEWQLLWSRSSLHLPPSSPASAASLVDPVDVRMQALRCADRLFRNVQAHPTEAKYKRVREANKVIAQELLPVEASAALLSFAGFVREAEESGEGEKPGGTGTAAAAVASANYVWVQPDAPAEAARKASAAGRVVGHLLEYMSEQQSRRFGVQQLWRSVALEVRLERAARELAVSGADPLRAVDDNTDEEAASAEHIARSNPFLAYLVECYTVDEAGDGLYSSLQHLQTLQRMYEAQVHPANTAVVNGAESAVQPPSSSSSSSLYSLLETAEVYGAVVQQRGAVELLLHGCGAQLRPFPAAVQRVTAAEGDHEKTAAAAAAFIDEMYTVELLPSSIRADAATHVARCARLLTQLREAVEAVQRQRADVARTAAEKSMRQELRRERQRQQLEQGHVRGEAEAESPSRLRRARLQGDVPHHTSSSAASSSSSASSSGSPAHARRRSGGDGEATGDGGHRRIPIAEALAILMGKKSPPTSRPPAASSS